MSPEIHVSPRTLALRTNGAFSLTERGHLVHELVRIQRTLEHNANPRAQLAISGELEQEYRARREELCCQLGLPSDERIREKTIQGWDGRLRQMGLPHYRIIK